MSNITATAATTATTATTAIKVIPLRYSADSVRAALIALKGSEKGPATFEAVAPVFSALIASGGSKAELSETSSTAQVFKELHAVTLKTSTAKAFRATCIEALKDFKSLGRAKSQDAHDTRLIGLSAIWCGFFKDAAPAKAKPEGYETPAKKIERLEAELCAMRIERNAMAELVGELRNRSATVAA